MDLQLPFPHVLCKSKRKIGMGSLIPLSQEHMSSHIPTVIGMVRYLRHTRENTDS